LREENRSEDRGRFGVELACDRIDAEDKKEEIEAIERPAKECGQKHMALRSGELSKRGESGHWREHSRRAARNGPDSAHTTETGVGTRADGGNARG